VGDKVGCALVLFNLGTTAATQQIYVPSQAYYLESLALFDELGAIWGVAWCLAGMAFLAWIDGHRERAARLFGAADALTILIHFNEESPGDADAERLWARARADLDTAAFALAWAEGRAMPREQAVATAVALM